MTRPTRKTKATRKASEAVAILQSAVVAPISGDRKKVKASVDVDRKKVSASVHVDTESMTTPLKRAATRPKKAPTSLKKTKLSFRPLSRALHLKEKCATNNVTVVPAPPFIGAAPSVVIPTIGWCLVQARDSRELSSATPDSTSSEEEWSGGIFLFYDGRCRCGTVW